MLGPGVALEQALVILGDREQLDVPAVRDREDRDFLALEERLDDDGGPGIAEDALAEHGADRGGGFAARETDDGSLAGGEAGGLDDQWLGMAVDVVEGGAELGERAAGGGGNAGGVHHFLRERLGRLELRGRRARPEHRASLRAEAIREPAGQRYLGADHGEIDAVHVGRVGDPVQVIGGDREVASPGRRCRDCRARSRDRRPGSRGGAPSRGRAPVRLHR